MREFGDLEDMLNKMEELLSRIEDNGFDMELEERLQDLYEEAKREISDKTSEVSHIPDSQVEAFVKKLKLCKKRFESICNDFENPDDIREVSMNNMFPDEDSMEGFDWG